MPDSVSDPAPSVADYDSFAAAYSASNENNRRRPGGPRRRMRVGPLMEALRGKDLVVSGVDLSPMVELARQRLGEEADVRVADLGAPLPYPDDAFDLVVASLSLHYRQHSSGTPGQRGRSLLHLLPVLRARSALNRWGASRDRGRGFPAAQ